MDSTSDETSLFKPFGMLENLSAQVPWAVFPRKKLDVNYSDLLSGILSCFSAKDEEREHLTTTIERFWDDGSTSNTMVCLSVRTGFDLLLRALDLPRGSEILCSAITIPDMIAIIRHHGLVPVPVDLNKETCFLDLDSLKKVIGKKSRGLLLAHVFGTRHDLDQVIDFAQRHQLLVIEDCAQGYNGRNHRGHPKADVAMFSFGTIKTATSFGGALICLKDKQLLEKLKTMYECYPIRPRKQFLARLIKYLALHGFATPALYGLVVYVCRLCNVNHDEVITSAIRGFSGGDLFTLIRQRPSVPLLALLWRRLSHFDERYLELRRLKCETLASLLGSVPGIEIPGQYAELHFYWLFPVIVPSPQKVALLMTKDGFDVTSGATQLTYVDLNQAERNASDVDVPTPHQAKDIITSLVYLPVTPEMPLWVMKKMVESLEHALAISSLSKL